jgi:hypothetical protein
MDTVPLQLLAKATYVQTKKHLEKILAKSRSEMARLPTGTGSKKY